MKSATSPKPSRLRKPVTQQEFQSQITNATHFDRASIFSGPAVAQQGGGTGQRSRSVRRGRPAEILKPLPIGDWRVAAAERRVAMFNGAKGG